MADRSPVANSSTDVSPTNTPAQDDAPIIALSGKMTVNDKGEKVSSKSVQNMKALLERAGAKVVIIDPTKAKAGDTIGYDGAVFMGNDMDIDPAKYGQKPDPKTKIETDPNGRSEADTTLAIARSQYEDAAMALALQTNVPTFGVCAGMQRMNVLCGGDLIQDVPGHDQSHLQDPQKPYTPVINIEFEKDTRLARIAGDKHNIYTPSHGTSTGTEFDPACSNLQYDDHKVNMFHHQAIGKVAEGFRKTAVSEDGVTEGIELNDPKNPSRFAMGVQWHPEFMPDNPLSQKLVQAVVDAAKERHKAKEKLFEEHGVDDNQSPNVPQRGGARGLQ